MLQHRHSARVATKKRGLDPTDGMKLLDTFVVDAEQETSLDGLSRLLSRNLQPLGFHEFLYITDPPPARGPQMPLVLTSLPEPVVNELVARGAGGADPMVQKLADAVVPFTVKQAIDEFCAAPSERRAIWRRAVESGLSHGLVIPLRGVVGFPNHVTFWADSERVLQEAWRHHRSGVFLVALYFHAAARRLVAQQPPLEPLSEREIDCLAWSARGKSTWDTARILEISERTVKFHLANATRKLRAANRTEAVARAIALGIVAL